MEHLERQMEVAWRAYQKAGKMKGETVDDAGAKRMERYKKFVEAITPAEYPMTPMGSLDTLTARISQQVPNGEIWVIPDWDPGETMQEWMARWTRIHGIATDE